MNVIDEIAAERRRQIEVEGWTLEHDDQHQSGELAAAAGIYALYDVLPDDGLRDRLISKCWPWDDYSWKPKDRRRDLIRAAALIVAEIERLDRAESKT
ncbi:MAG: hypothetical protein ACK4ST_02555 [Elioraea tepidiphila]